MNIFRYFPVVALLLIANHPVAANAQTADDINQVLQQYGCGLPHCVQAPPPVKAPDPVMVSPPAGAPTQGHQQYYNPGNTTQQGVGTTTQQQTTTQPGVRLNSNMNNVVGMTPPAPPRPISPPAQSQPSEFYGSGNTFSNAPPRAPPGMHVVPNNQPPPQPQPYGQPIWSYRQYPAPVYSYRPPMAGWTYRR